MRIVTDLPENQLAYLEDLCEEKDISRAEAIRRVIAESMRQKRKNDAVNALSGIWKGKLKVDALEYQRVVREGGSIDDLFTDNDR